MPRRIEYGEGVVVVLLLPFVFYFLRLISILNAAFASILLLGVWTMISSFVIMGKEELRVYFAWGLVIASISSFFVVSATYAVAILLIAIIVSVLLFVSGRKAS